MRSLSADAQSVHDVHSDTCVSVGGIPADVLDVLEAQRAAESSVTDDDLAAMWAHEQQQWENLPSLRPITFRPVRLNPSAWPQPAA